MEYVPESLTEQEEGALIGGLTRVAHEMGMDAYRAWADNLIMTNKAYLLKYATPDNPALIRLHELMRKEERGFE